MKTIKKLALASSLLILTVCSTSKVEQKLSPIDADRLV